MSVATLDRTLDMAMQLPLEQQEMLLEIVRRRQIEMRRREIAEDAQVAIAAFRAGELQPRSADEVISELRREFVRSLCHFNSQSDDERGETI